MKLFTHRLSIEDGSVAVDTGVPGAPTGAEEPPQGESATPYSDRVDSMSSEERRHWKMTGEFPKTKSDVQADSSTAKKSESASKDGPGKTEVASDPTDDKQEKGKRANWSSLRERAAAAEARAELLEKQLAESRKPPVTATKEEPKVEVKPERPKRPRLEDPKYKTIAEYDSDMDKYETDLDKWKAQDEDRRFNTWKQDQETKSKESTRSQQIESMKKTHTDFETVAFNPKVPASTAILFHLENSPQGMELRYQLGKNLEEATRIAELTHVPGLEDALKSGKPLSAALLVAFGKAQATAEAELSKLAPKSATERTTVRRLPKPSVEVSVTGNSNGDLGDELAQAIASGDSSAYKRIVNKREMESRRRR